jgi:hypothetical protein
MWEGQPARREELTGLAAQLAMLKPRAQVDRDRLMFAAGRRHALVRLRIANGLLLATNVICGSLLTAVLAFAHFSDDSQTSPTSRAVAPGFAGDANNRGRVSTSIGSGSVFRESKEDSSLNIRLLRTLNRDDELCRVHRRPGSTMQWHNEDDSPKNYSRAVLHQYLERESPRL